jgi:hypothetical protein
VGRLATLFRGIIPIISNGNIITRDDVQTAATEGTLLVQLFFSSLFLFHFISVLMFSLHYIILLYFIRHKPCFKIAFLFYVIF